jgi:hypothetical protein
MEYHDEVLKLIQEDIWSQHSAFPREEWKREVIDGNTQLGYWEWVNHQIDMNEPCAR